MTGSLYHCGLLGITLLGFQQKEEMPTAKEVSAQVRKVYSTCETYRDTCLTERVENGNGQRSVSKGEAKTAYQNGGHFRFEFHDTSEWERFSPSSKWKPVVWSNGKEWKYEPGFSDGFKKRVNETELEDLRFALRALTFQTLETSGQIPLLILPKGKSPVGDYFHGERGSIEKIEKIDNQDCYKLTYHDNLVDGRNDTFIKKYFRFWIDKNNHLIRRFQWELVFADDTKNSCTLNYQPEINVKLSKEELELNPPKK